MSASEVSPIASHEILEKKERPPAQTGKQAQNQAILRVMAKMTRLAGLKIFPGGENADSYSQKMELARRLIQLGSIKV